MLTRDEYMKKEGRRKEKGGNGDGKEGARLEKERQVDACWTRRGRRTGGRRRGETVIIDDDWQRGHRRRVGLTLPL